MKKANQITRDSMTIEVPEWKKIIIFSGVVVLLLCQFITYITTQGEVARQKSKLQQLLENDSICPNGSRKCLPGYRDYTVVRNHDDQEHGNFPPMDSKPPKKLTKRKKAHSLKSAKRGKQTFPERRKENYNAIRISNDDIIAWNLHADMKVYMFDMEGHEDPNTSEEANFNKASSKEDFKRKSDAVAPQNAVMNKKRRDYLKVPTPYSTKEANSELEQFTSSSTDSDGDLNDIIFHWIEKLGYAMVGFLLGIVARHYWTSFLRCLPSDALSWFISSKGYKRLDKEEQPRIEVDRNLNLSRLPPDLEDFIAMKLDIRRKGERSAGWRKVGAEFKVNQDHLRYLDIEYKRDNGSPTVKLLQILGMNSNKTIADLVEVLKSAKVNRCDIANLIILT